MTDRATVRLRPKVDARRIRHGFPWVYDNELVTDRRTKALTPGALAVLEDAERQPLGLAAVSPGSRIICRLLDPSPDAEIGAEWIATRIAKAQAHRSLVFDAPFYRLVHAEADGLPGVVIDRFGDIAVIQPNAAWAEAHLALITEALAEVSGVTTIVKNAGGRARKLEGLEGETEVLTGSLDGPVEVPMNGAIYMADLLGGQKTGLFFDQRANQAAAAQLAPKARVLDVFSHVGGFALAALAAGADSAVAVDSSAPALDLAKQGAAAAGLTERFHTMQGDAFEAMNALAQEKIGFELVVCDPPAFAPNRGALDAGLRAYEKVARNAAGLVAEGGYLVLCSCSHAATLDKFRAACARGIGRAGRRAQLVSTGFASADHPQHLQLAESSYLKALFFRML
ncbi:MAG: class I SAM-dependent rRNA methyltransferase [Pseudomonadota bacterium]